MDDQGRDSATAAGSGGSGLSHRQVLVVLCGLMLGMLLAALDQTVVATALPTIVGELGGLDQLSWVVTAYLLAATATIPLYGKLGDLYGRKLVYQVAVLVFLLGSVLAGLAQDMPQLIAFRALQGLGGGGLLALPAAVIGEIVSPRERGRYQGYLGVVFALASVVGPPLGGLLTEQLSWRWAFYVNLPLGLAALAVTGVALDLPFRRRRHAIDYLGAGLLTGGVSCLLLVTVWGGGTFAWGSPVIVGLASAAAVLVCGFALWERRAAEPILPPRLFRDRVFVTAASGMLLMAVAMFGAIVFLPLFLQLVMGVSASSAGLLLTPMMGGIVVASVIAGRLITRTGRYRLFPIVGTAVLLAAYGLLATTGVGTRPAVVAGYAAVAGVGLGLVMQVLVLAVQNTTDRQDLGTATSAMSFARSLGGSLGVALFGAVMSSRLTAELQRLLPGGVLPSGVDVDAVGRDPSVLATLTPAVRGEVAAAFASSIRAVFLVGILVVVGACVAAWLLPEWPLRDRAHAAEGTVAAGREAGAGGGVSGPSAAKPA